MIVSELRGKFKLKWLLESACISKQLYYYTIQHIENKNTKDAEVLKEIVTIYNKNYKKYGEPRITIELQNLGLKINHKRVERIMKENQISAAPKRKKYKSYKGTVGKIAQNMMNRNFKTQKIYQKIGTDVTVFITPYAKVYLSPIIDFHSREILAYDVSTKPDYRQIDRMFKCLSLAHGDVFKNTVLQSDQGWQYQMKTYRDKLKELDMIQSMSRKGNCLDNSPTENFFGRMKEEMFYGKKVEHGTAQEVIKEIHKYISYYNHDRIVVKLKSSPINFRNLYNSIGVGL